LLQFALAEDFNAGIQLDTYNTVWLEALPARKYHTPMYGEVPISVETLQRMIKGFKENVRGQDIAINFDHGFDRAKGNKAAGWFKDFAIDTNAKDGSPTLKAQVQFTDEAAQEIKGGSWKYFSLEWDDEWMANDGTKYEDVIVGGAITNRPVAKHMETLPVNFSEVQWADLDDKEKKRFLIDASKRQAKIKSLAVAKEKNMSEEVVQQIEAGTLVLVDEVREWEHSEPGTGPTPRTTETVIDPGTGQPVVQPGGNPADDPAIGGGWRREPMPPPDVTDRGNGQDKGDTALTEEELKALRKALGLKEDATITQITEAATTTFSEAAETRRLRELAGAAGEEKEFAERYPAMHKQMVEDRTKLRNNDAKTFSESVARVKRQEGEQKVDSDKGLSALALDTIKEVHLKFSEGTATREDFEKAVTTIVHGGIVDFSETGSSQAPEPQPTVDTKTAEGIANGRKLFAEKIAEIQRDDKLDFRAAMEAAAVKYPELAKAYSATAVA
jgi:hypothetical protein